jgi:hypothetical protein
MEVNNPSLEIKDFKAEGVVEILYSHIITLDLRVKSLENKCDFYDTTLKEIIKRIEENKGFVCEHVTVLGNKNGL